jgi:hypothetical protein
VMTRFDDNAVVIPGRVVLQVKATDDLRIHEDGATIAFRSNVSTCKHGCGDGRGNSAIKTVYLRPFVVKQKVQLAALSTPMNPSMVHGSLHQQSRRSWRLLGVCLPWRTA